MSSSKISTKAKDSKITASSGANARKEDQFTNRIRIKIKAYDHKVIDTSVRQIVETALRHGAEVHGPTPLPTEFHKYTVNRSSFIYKDSREQFEMRIHKRLIDILNPSPQVIDALMDLNLPAGVDVEIKM